MHDYKLYLEQIVDMIKKISKSNLDKMGPDSLLLDATLMRLQVIGESSKKIPVKIKKIYPNIPWRALEKMRNFISHNYLGINEKIIRKSIEKHVLPSELSLKKILSDKRSDNLWRIPKK